MSYRLYDIFTKQIITINDGEIMAKCKDLKIDNTHLAKMGDGKHKTLLDRYILEKDKDKIFTLIDFETEKEYDCINNNSLFIQLGIDQATVSSNETKYIYELKKKRQVFASICGKIFKLKGGKEKVSRFKKLKAEGFKYSEILAARKFQSKLISRIRSRISDAVSKRAKIKIKKNRTMNLLGCSISFYMKYLEDRFSEGMNWLNYGKGEGFWSIEHCIPCAHFDLTSIENQKKCFHYTNTIPMWWRENISKNDKTPEEWEEYKRKKRV